ncbi:MAG: 50S ribosomal protein L32 [Patescibacteria group bacterium]
MALKPSQIFACQNCAGPILPHKMCGQCGNYKGRIVREPKLKIKK